MGEVMHLRPQPDANLPHSIEAEQAILGAVLTDNAVWHRVATMLQPEHFFEALHGRIYDIAGRRIRAGHLVSPVTMRDALEGDQTLPHLGGPAYLVRLAGAAVASAAVEYAKLVAELHQRRGLIQAAQAAVAGLIERKPLAEVATGLAGVVQRALDADTTKPATVSILRAVSTAMETTVAAVQGHAPGLVTGIKELDRITGGFHPEDLVILAGGPSMGKTTLAMAMVRAWAAQGCGVAVASLEMSAASLAQRLLSAEAGVAYRSMRRGAVSPEQGQDLARRAAVVGDWNLQIMDSHVRDLQAIHATAQGISKAMADRGAPLRVLVVDYLQLVRAPGKDRFQQVAEVSMGLKHIARSLGVPVVALSQISRDVAGRDDKRPKLSDLRESAQIEQDADMVLFCHRDFYYLERQGAPRGKDGKVSVAALADHDAALAQSRNQMEVILAKHRHDGIGVAMLGCDMATNRVWDLHDGNIEAARGFL